ncbi:MAG: glycosyltransferase family 1 protein, partial [candidate division Zixibacteria bacterium]|nr:glycosyltransferase family 1 protein [candidate division Zixibacteria bacterium]
MNVVPIGVLGKFFDCVDFNVNTARKFRDSAATGGGVYLTTYNPDLAMEFDIGREILCYRNREEAIEMIMDYLARPDDCQMIAKRARERHCRVLKIVLWIAPLLLLCPLLPAQVDSRAAEIQAARARKAQSLEPDETSGTERALVHFKDAKLLERISAGIAG